MQNTFGSLGLIAPTDVITDGQIHRTGTEKKPTGTDGWYVARDYDGHIYMSLGNWQTGEKTKYTDNGLDREASTINWTRFVQDEKAALTKAQKTCIDKAQALISTLKRIEKQKDHPYLVKKNIEPCGEVYKFHKKLIIPMYNRGELVSYQEILPKKDPVSKRDKNFPPGTKKRGSYFLIPGDQTTTYIVEGYATGCTVHEATGCQVRVAWDAGNIVHVARQTKGHAIIATDNDSNKTGENSAKKTGKPWYMPPEVGTDFNDIGVEATREILSPRESLAVIPKTDTQPEQILFPAETIYAKAPEVYKRIYGEWLDSIVEPVAGFAFATIEASMQVLCGQLVKTPAHNRTVVTFALCGSHSGAGKDLSSKNPLRKLRQQLMSAHLGTITDNNIYGNLTTGIGNITGDTAMLATAEAFQGSFLWLTTEASEPLRQLSSNSTQASQGSSLATALNDSYDGHEITGKQKAGQSIKAIDSPLIPVCWLTQLAELKQQLTQKLLEIGTLGRFDYILDYNPVRSIRSSFEGVPVVGEEASDEEMDKIINPFSDKTIELIAEAIAKRPEGPLIFTPKSRDYICELDIALRKKYDSTEGIGKFICRTMMSVEKRLTAWVAMDGRRIIEVSDIDAILPWLQYQVAMREQVYTREIRKDSDLLKAIKDTLQKCVYSGYGDITRKQTNSAKYNVYLKGGYVYRTDFNSRFKKLYGEAFPSYMVASALKREIDTYISQNEIGSEFMIGHKSDFLFIPKDH